MRRVVILSPYRGDIPKNLEYLRRCLNDSVRRHEAPFASHILYPIVLNDSIPEQRSKGFECEAAWLGAADAVVVYDDLGISTGMALTIKKAEELNIEVAFRSLKE